MIPKNELCERLTSYMKKARGNEYLESYKTDKEAYDNFDYLLTNKPYGLCDELSEELHTLMVFYDLRKEDNLNLFKECSQLAIDMNQYYNSFKEKESDYEI